MLLRWNNSCASSHNKQSRATASPSETASRSNRPIEKAGNLLHEAVTHDLLSGSPSPEKIQHLNEQMLQVESNWLDPAGIPGRSWFQHLLYSSRYTYAHLEFPGLTEAVEKRDWKLAAQQAALLEKAVEKNTKLLRSAYSSWEKNKP